MSEKEALRLRIIKPKSAFGFFFIADWYDIPFNKEPPSVPTSTSISISRDAIGHLELQYNNERYSASGCYCTLDMGCVKQALEEWVAQGCFEGLKSETRFTVETATIGYYRDRVLDRKRGVVNFQSTLAECEAVAAALSNLHGNKSVNPYSCEWKQVEPMELTAENFKDVHYIPQLGEDHMCSQTVYVPIDEYADWVFSSDWNTGDTIIKKGTKLVDIFPYGLILDEKGRIYVEPEIPNEQVK